MSELTILIAVILIAVIVVFISKKKWEVAGKYNVVKSSRERYLKVQVPSDLIKLKSNNWQEEVITAGKSEQLLNAITNNIERNVSQLDRSRLMIECDVPFDSETIHFNEIVEYNLVVFKMHLALVEHVDFYIDKKNHFKYI